MEISKVTEVFFSPTYSTERIVRLIGEAWEETHQEIDLSRIPKERKGKENTRIWRTGPDSFWSPVLRGKSAGSGCRTVSEFKGTKDTDHPSDRIREPGL